MQQISIAVVVIIKNILCGRIMKHVMHIFQNTWQSLHLYLVILGLRFELSDLEPSLV